MHRALGFAVAAAASILLLGCFLTPGKFVSSLDVARDGSFTFAYKGELILVSNNSMMEEMNKSAEFTPSCTGDNGDKRDCTTAETAEQRRKFDEEQAAKVQRDTRERQEMSTFLGGIDPGNEKTMDEFAARLQREAGWKSVTHRGKGVFDVDYEVAGKLDRDFIFPVFPRFNFVVPALMITRRDDNAVLIRAPGFGQGNGGSDGNAMMPFGSGNSSKADGAFTLTTDADIATNNSEEGAITTGGRNKLEWRVTPLNRTPPEALLRLRS